MRHYFLLILIIISVVGCGKTGPLWLPEGVEDKSKYKYPSEVDTVCTPSDKDCE